MLRLLRLWRLAGQDLRLVWYALKHPGRPLWLWPAVIVLAVYALEPLNFALPVVGLVDEFILLPLALHAILSFLPAEIRDGYARRSMLR
jgi:uncharacterized membrane protein YkvA (DUF1232 family)